MGAIKKVLSIFVQKVVVFWSASVGHLGRAGAPAVSIKALTILRMPERRCPKHRGRTIFGATDLDTRLTEY